jgi:hypothetical protein
MVLWATPVFLFKRSSPLGDHLKRDRIRAQCAGLPRANLLPPPNWQPTLTAPAPILIGIMYHAIFAVGVYADLHPMLP